MIANPFEKSAQLADEEKVQIANRKAQMSMLAEKIEKLLIEEKCTWKEWHEILGMFDSRISRVVSGITVEEIQKKYNEQF